jgi:quercetin dioxygenase-like cupin family protein
MALIMQQPASDRPRYVAKQVETIMANPAIRARLFTLAPQEVVPLHRHSEITDHYFVLRGKLTIETRLAETHKDLRTGDRFQIAPGIDHQLANNGQCDCEFLLLQGIGMYDWISCPDSK